MIKKYEIEYIKIKEKDEYLELIEKVLNTCFKEEGLSNSNLYISITHRI